MGQPKPKPVFTVDQYLAYERSSEERHEYLDGEIFGMAGESGKHGDVSANLVITIGYQLKGKPCRIRTKDTKVRSGLAQPTGPSTKGMFSYLDIVVICDEPEYHDDRADAIVNPTVIIEVHSPSTEEFDRGEKFTRYQTWNPTLQDYLLVPQDQRLIEHWSRQGESWSGSRYSALDATVAIASIGCVLKLEDVYDRVVFSPGR